MKIKEKYNEFIEKHKALIYYIIMVVIIANIGVYISLLESCFQLEAHYLNSEINNTNFNIIDLKIITYLKSGGLYQNTIVLMATFLYDFSKTKDKDNELSISSNLAILLLIVSSIFGYTEKEGFLYTIIEIFIWLWALKINCRLFIKNNIEVFSGKEYEASTPEEEKLKTIDINDIESDGDVKL